MRKIVTRKAKLENKIRGILSGLPSPEPEVSKILDAVDDFESANLATIDKLKKKKKITSNRINGALKQSINAHGPITKLLIGSASKRIHGSLLTDEPEKEKISIKGFLYGVGLSFIIYVIVALIS